MKPDLKKITKTHRSPEGMISKKKATFLIYREIVAFDSSKFYLEEFWDHGLPISLLGLEIAYLQVQ